ncbi:acetate--CoA ligase family protein [Desulfospira joergensenii]|uniref:acetate--CoA ligase family protein n=1 Tax=Desulfospira joergensenii TaxID=53329 RepID=UPI0003B72CB9|nr:acetate--CoA ligase family protein [Desulfospira joergensenii]
MTMLKKLSRQIIENSRETGWVLEPDAKALMRLAGLDIPDFILTDSIEAAGHFLDRAGCPVAAKAVSKKILHKTEHRAVVTGIASKDHLKREMERLLALDGCEKVLIEEMVMGIELIIGAKNDFQFGPVVVFGLGGTAVEVYRDTAVRMAPLKPGDVVSMVESLKARDLVLGHRGGQGVNMEALTRMMEAFSCLIIELEHEIESVDLNPVICTGEKCIIADARIILK